jgi:hypothetical protein
MARRIIVINEHAPTLDMREGIRKVPAHALQRGDVTSANGERVVSVQRAADSADRVEVVLAKEGMRRHLHWHQHAMIGVLNRTNDAEAEWITVTQAVYQQLQVGKSYKINGRSCRVLEKSQSSGQTNAAGWGSAIPMVKVQWKTGANDTPKSFWSYQASTETPSLEKAIEIGAISARTTPQEWDRMSPGMKREIVRSHERRSAKDGIGTPEEIAYGEGWHSTQRGCPYDEPELTTAWERGRKARQQQRTMTGSYFRGEVRGKRFDPPRIRQSDAGTGMWEVEYTLLPHIAKREGVTPNQGEAFSDASEARKAFSYYKRNGECSRVVLKDPYGKSVQTDAASRDFKSEKGYVAKLIDAQTGRELARSEPHISNGVGLKTWVQTKANELIRSGKRVKAEVSMVFYDPLRI